MDHQSDPAAYAQRMITIENHGPLITKTNYWCSDIGRAGKLFVSCNAGAVRLLLPRSMTSLVGEWRSSRHVVLSRGPCPEAGEPDAVELLFEDGSDAPYSMHLTPASFDALPGEPEPGREWVFAAWTAKHGRPHKALERRCLWRRSDLLPDLAPWGGYESD